MSQLCPKCEERLGKCFIQRIVMAIVLGLVISAVTFFLSEEQAVLSIVVGSGSAILMYIGARKLFASDCTHL
jgi:hypothetical protein